MSRHNYNLFHTFVDGISIVIAASIFTIIWNSRHLLDNDYFLFAGVGFLFFAFLDVVHVLGNKGMGILSQYGNLGPTFYIASRYLLGISMFLAPLFIRRKLNTALAFGAYGLAALMILLSVFEWKIFPACIVEGVGLTPFKIISDYIISLLFAGAIVLLYINRRSFDPRVLRLIIYSMVLSIATGLTFALYADPFGLANALGHFFQIGSFYLVYRAFIITSVTKPQEILYRKLKQNEGALADKAEELAAILDAVPIPVIIVHDPDSLHMTGNRASEELLKQPKGAEVSLSAPPEQRPRHFKAIKDGRELSLEELPAQRAARGENVRDFEFSIVFDDGATKDVLGYGTPMKDNQGNPRGAIHALVEITKRKRAEQALNESEARYRLLSATASRLLDADDPQAIVEGLCRDVMAHLDCQAFFNFLADEKSGRLRLNACAGIPEEEVRKLEWLDYGVAVCGCVAQAKERIAEDIFHVPDIRTDLVKSFGIQAYCCHPLMAQDRLIGTLSFGATTRAHFKPAEVELMRIVADQVAVAMQRKLTQEAVSQAKAEWERTFDSVPDLITILDKNHRILRTNKAMAERLNRQPEQCIGAACHEVVHGLDRPPHFCPHALTLSDGREHVAEVHEPCLGGIFLVSSTPLIDAAGEPIGSVHVARDITKRKQAEEALRERTAELEGANRELESFSYSVSHDLRAPLRTIDGFSRMLLRDLGENLDEESRRKLNIVRENTERMNCLIDDLLDLSRLGRQALVRSPLDMKKLFSEAWEELLQSAPERNVRFVLGELSAASGDRALVKQVVLNLLSNALKYSRDRDPAVIEIASTNGDGSVVFSVKDNGAGFDMQYYERLFGVFRRLHSQSEFEGTGVGLAIVKRIVQRHGGRVWAEGEVGRGAVFYFSLPAVPPKVFSGR